MLLPSWAFTCIQACLYWVCGALWLSAPWRPRPQRCHGLGPSQPGNMEIYLFLISWLIYFWEVGTCRVLHNLGSRPTDEGYNEVLRLLEMYYCVGKYGKISNMKLCTKQSFNGTQRTMEDRNFILLFRLQRMMNEQPAVYLYNNCQLLAQTDCCNCQLWMQEVPTVLAIGRY